VIDVVERAAPASSELGAAGRHAGISCAARGAAVPEDMGTSCASRPGRRCKRGRRTTRAPSLRARPARARRAPRARDLLHRMLGAIRRLFSGLSVCDERASRISATPIAAITPHRRVRRGWV